MKMNKEQQEQFDGYATKFARDLKNIFTFESSERYLKQQSIFKYSAFCVEYLNRYNVFGDEVSDDKLIEDNSLYRKFERIVIPVFRECIEELKIEREEKIKEERKRAKEESDKGKKKRKKK
jgi:hypothetical protein